MDTRRTSTCLTSQSMATKDICILVVHNDPVYRNIILKMLENCSHYEVMKFKRTADALNIIQEKKEQLSIVVTDVHRSLSNGSEILNYIEKELKLPAIPMTPHQSAGVVPVGLDSDAKLYFAKSLSVDEFKIHWQHAYREERGKTSFQSVSVVQERETGTSAQSKSPIQEVIREDQNHENRKSEETGEQSEEDKDDNPNEKKRRLTWNQAMHHEFLKAIQLLGHDKASPKNIEKIMNIPGLTRKNIASHLQNYRMCVRRAKEENQSTSSIFGINSTHRFFQSNHSNFIPQETNHLQHHTQGPVLTPNQPRLSPFNIPNFSSPETSSSISNLGKQQFPYAHNSFLVSSTQGDMCPIITNMPLSNSFSNYPETSTTTLNLEQQNSVTINNNQMSLIFPNTNNFPIIDTTQINPSPITNENPQLGPLNTTSYVGPGFTDNGELVNCDQISALNINSIMEDEGPFFNEGNGNESSVHFPSMEIANNSEQPFNMAPAEFEIGDLWEETERFDKFFGFDDSIL